MLVKLFHKDVFFPLGMKESIISFKKSFNNYVLSKHLQEHLNNNNKDRSHDYLEKALNRCLTTIKTNPQQPFEVELSKDPYFFGSEEWFVTKYCVRVSYNDKQDIVIAIRPYYDKNKHCYDGSRNKVVTAWMNAKDDAHFTLDTTKYCSSREWDYYSRKQDEM